MIFKKREKYKVLFYSIYEIHFFKTLKILLKFILIFGLMKKNIIHKILICKIKKFYHIFI